MSTTTLRLPDELKVRMAKAAKNAGVTPHLFMLEAVAEKIEQAEKDANFEAVAELRYVKILEGGETLSWEDVRGYLKARAAGRPQVRPSAHNSCDA